MQTQYLGEEGSNCALKGAVIVSNPWKLEVSSLALQRTYIGLNLYSKTMGTSMRKLFDLHRDEIVKNTALDISRIEKVKYLFEFDREVQCATWGYPTEGAYYRDASSADSVLGIRVPTLCLHAQDDPIACDEAVPYEEIRQNPYVVMTATDGGGHLCWFEWGGGRWHSKPVSLQQERWLRGRDEELMERQIVNFLNTMLKEVTGVEAPKTKTAQSNSNGGHRTPFVFEPMRRKMHVVENQSGS